MGYLFAMGTRICLPVILTVVSFTVSSAFNALPANNSNPSFHESDLVSNKNSYSIPNEDSYDSGSIPDSEKVSYDGARLLRVVNANEQLNNKLEELEDAGVVEIWSHHDKNKDVMVKREKVEEVSNLLAANNISYRIVIENLERAIHDENPDITENEDRNKLRYEWRRDVWMKPSQTNYKIKQRMNQKNNRYYFYYYRNNYNKRNNNIHRNYKAYKLTWQRYHRFSDHQEYINYLENQYPDLVSVTEIGKSVEGRPIKVIKISSGKPDADAMWIDGGTHAREWISPASVTYIINEFVENRAVHEKSISNVDFYIAPIINPDGYEYSHTVDRLWRKNRRKNKGYCVGIDLNRNWGYRWGGAGSSKQPCKEIYAGSKAFSEPETKAVSDFVLSKKDKLKGYVTFHSYGQYILYPWGYDSKVPPDYADLDRVGRKAAVAIQNSGGPAYTVGNSASTLYSASGGSDDWAKGVAGIKYTYTIELRDNGRYGFVLPAQFIEPTSKEALAAVKVIAEEINKL